MHIAGCADESAEKRIASAKEYLQKKRHEIGHYRDQERPAKEPGSRGGALPAGQHAAEAKATRWRPKWNCARRWRRSIPGEQVVPELGPRDADAGPSKKVVDEFGQAHLGAPTADAKLQTLLAATYAVLGKSEQSRSALSAALLADPKYADALLLSARQKAAARDIDGALAVIDDLITREPDNADAWKFRGDLVLYGKNQPEEALAAFRKALGSEPKHLAAHAAIVNVLMRQGKLDDAGKQIEELKRFAAKSLPTRFFEVQLAYAKKDFKSARQRVQELLQQAPNDPRLLELAGAIELQLGVPAQAQIYLSRALQVTPELPFARRLLIVTYLRSGQPAKALTELDGAVGKDGMHPSLYGLAGEVHLQNGDPKKAEDYFAKALKSDPEDARKRTALAITHLAAGKADMAIDELQDIAGSDTGITADLALISTYLRGKEFEKALAAIDKLEAKQPDKPIAANLRGRVQLAQKDNTAARKSFERALAIDPNFFAAAASLAAIDVADNKPEDAKKRFEALLAKDPKNGQALLALAQLAANQKASREEIASLLGKAIDANPTDASPRLMLIELHMRSSAYKQAMASAQSAAVAVPSSTEVLVALGRAQLASGETNQAVATFGKLVGQHPSSPRAHSLLAGAQIANKDKQAARQSLRKALEINPDELDAQRGLIILSIEAKNYADANKIARTVQEQRPKSPVGFVFEGDIANSRKDWDAAARAYRAALQKGSAPEIATKLHAVLLAAGKGAEAQRFAASWQKEHPRDAAFLSYQGELALSRKDYAAAEKHFLAALDIQPDSEVVLNNVAWVMGQLQQAGAALEYAEKANRLAPNRPAFMDTLAMLLAGNGDIKRAIELQNKALALQPTNAGLRLNLAKIYIQSGDKARAKTELEKLVKTRDEFAGRAEADCCLRPCRAIAIGALSVALR